MVERQVKEEGDRQLVLQILERRNYEYAYYSALVRQGDINVLMRLRD